MNNSPDTHIPSAFTGSRERKMHKNNPNIALRILEVSKRLTAAGKSRQREGANYRLSGALRSNKVPTDRRLIGRRLSDVTRRR